MADLGTSTLGEMRTEVLNLLGKPSSSLLVQKIDAAINRAMEWAVKQGEWPTLTRTDEFGLFAPADSTSATFQSASAFAALPWGCRNVQAMFLQGSNSRRELRQISPEEMSRLYSVTETGAPAAYAIVGETCQHTPIASSESFTITGNAVNDNISTVRIWYRQQSGHLGEVVSPALSGSFSTGVTSPSAATSGWPIERITVSENWAGPITITGATELVKIESPFGTAASNPMSRIETRPLVRLGPTPDADYAGTVIWRRVPRRLLKADDAPEVPVSAALVYAAAADLLRIDKRFSQANAMEAKKIEAVTGEGLGEQSRGGFAAPEYGNFLDQTGSGRYGYNPW